MDNQHNMALQFLVEVPRRPQKIVKSNYISTTKYNIVTFLPLALIGQFRRYANIYFLICAILQSIPIISPLQPFSAIAPLVFVLLLSLLRQGYEDYKRYNSDETDNSQLTLYYKSQEQVVTKWKDIKQGDFMLIKKDQTIPADCYKLISSNKSGISYVETASLDGEKNLKPKFSNSQFQKQYNKTQTIPNFQKMHGRISCINPTALIEAFEGVAQLTFSGTLINQKINKKNMMLRGCKLKNTEWVIGIVIYTGEDTAIMMNGSKPFTKISNIQKKVNKYIIALLATELLCNFACAGYCYYQCITNYSFESFVTNSTPDCVNLAIISFGSYFILFSTFIPISLIVSLEFVKVFQGNFMSTDQQMYCAINNRRLQCRTVSINQQLGQIDYILTDKTGTLTCNKMQFRNIVIGNQIYGQNLNINSFQNINYESLSNRFSQSSKQQYSFDSRRLSYDLQSNEQHRLYSQKQLIQLIFLMITTCHECVPSQNGGYQGPSPDQVSLIKAAEKVGFKFVSSQNKLIKIEYKGKIIEFEQLKLIQFDSDRKRMTVIVKSSSNVYVFVKGADTSLTKILAPNQQYLKSIRTKTQQMSRTGLRSLWFAYKILPSFIDIHKLSEKQIESQLILIGATGIQDKLQDYVAQTIFSLRSGGIKFIMLTGDKLQTAQNIARSCRLIQQGYLIKNKADLHQFVQQIDKLENQMHSVTKSPVIDGSAINFQDNLQQLQIAIQKTKSVVFSRVTPGQKAQIVRLVKNMGKVTLAIGDGANDVNMIMQANVGVGIFGQEGTRAAQVANYAIGQFCLLWKLLLFYGRLNYIRVCQMILYFFYKNMAFTAIQLIYCFYSMGSGQSFWLSWSITCFNLIFTFWPVVLRAVFEVDIELKPTKQTFHQLSQGKHKKQTLYSYYPKMYYLSQKNKLFTNSNFFSWLVLGAFQGAICLIITIYSVGFSGASSRQMGFYLIQISSYTSIIVVVTIKLAVNVKHWTLLLAIGFLIPSIGGYVVYTFICQVFQNSISYLDMIDLLSTPTFYIIQIICVGMMFCFDFFLFSLEMTKNNFENYLKNKTLKQERLSQSNLNQYFIEMVEVQKKQQYE